MFEKVAYEQWSGRKLLRWLRDETDFKTSNGINITLSMVYRFLNDTFYYGEFKYPVGSDKWYEGKHDPIISKTLFDHAREHVNRDNIERHECKEFAFTKLMKCGHCGSGITADEKFKKFLDGSVNRYVYYGCTRSRDRDCKGGYMREEELVKQLSGILETIDLDELGIRERFNEKIERHYKFTRGVLGIHTEPKDGQKEIDLRNYVKYLLKEGSLTEKRALLSCLQSKLVMREKRS